MRNTCVRWATPVLATMTLIIAAGMYQPDHFVSAQSPDPLLLPRLAFANLTYVGGFRLPRNAEGGDDFSYGGQHLAYNPARNSLFASSLHNNVAEVTIPVPANTTDPNQMPFASYLQPFTDPTEGHFREFENGGPNPAVLAGLLVQGNRLYATGSIYYDALDDQVVTHFSHSTDLSEQSFAGMSQVWETGKAGYVGGYMATIPLEWQSRLGGPSLTGQCCIPIVSRTSFGPAAFGFDPSGIGHNTALPATPLLYYTQDHPTLGPWEGTNAVYGGTTSMGGVAVIAGTRTALFVGRNGLGAFCYGHGVDDKALAGRPAADGVMNCYDPTTRDKGQHGYPYRYQIWAYDLADFAAVRAGTKQPWDVEPYGVWPLNLPFPAHGPVRIGGVAYDAQRQVLYVSQFRADVEGFAERPIVHTWKINGASSAATPLSPAVSLTTGSVAPQPTGALIRWSAAVTGPAATYEYKWSARANGAWSVLRDWSASSTLDWRPVTAASDARVAVAVRSSRGTASTDYPFAIFDPGIGVPSTPASSLKLTANRPAPQPAGSAIVWTASPTGGSGPMAYKWFVYELGLWNPVGSWTSSNQFTWRPASADGSYRVSAWVKRASSTAEGADASAEQSFAITEPADAPSNPRVDSVTLASDTTAPKPAGTTIVFTATPTGGSGALVYKWLVFNGALWQAMGSWTASNHFSWTPAAANAGYKVSVWVKRASSTLDEFEATAERPFAITAGAPGSTPPQTPPAPSGTRVASVALATNVPAPQPAGATIVWTATPTGGGSEHAYKWFVYELGLWKALGSWTASNHFSWTPTVANASYKVSVWVKRASSSAEGAEASSERPFAIAAAGSAPTPPPASTPPPATSSTRVSSVALTTNVPAPQPAGSTIGWTATASGGGTALVYKWFVYELGLWRPVGSWTASNHFTWNPAAANAGYKVSVWVKRASSTAEGAEASAERPFAITAAGSAPTPPPASTPPPATSSTRVSSVALATNMPAPQPAGSTIGWTATATGGGTALVYKWFVFELGLWKPVGSWTASNHFNWTPAVANSSYRVSVWVKRASSAAEGAEASAERPFAIITAGSPPAPAPVPGSTRVISVALTTNLPAPQKATSTITWTATPTGGTTALAYKWFVFDGGRWTPVGSWTSSNQFIWTPTKANANYRVSAGVKSAATAADQAEASSERPFAITAP